MIDFDPAPETGLAAAEAVAEVLRSVGYDDVRVDVPSATLKATGLASWLVGRPDWADDHIAIAVWDTASVAAVLAELGHQTDVIADRLDGLMAMGASRN